MASKAEEIDVEGVAVRLTNRDKPYFPKLGSKGTKGALFDYYLSVADRMVKLLRDRPVHLQRFPDGIEGRRSTRSAFRRSIPTTWRPASSRFRRGAPPMP